MVNLNQTYLTHSKKEGNKVRVIDPVSAQMCLLDPKIQVLAYQ